MPVQSEITLGRRVTLRNSSMIKDTKALAFCITRYGNSLLDGNKTLYCKLLQTIAGRATTS